MVRRKGFLRAAASALVSFLLLCQFLFCGNVVIVVLDDSYHTPAAPGLLR